MNERELIVEMELRTKDDIIQLLKSNGLGQKRDYCKAKKVVFKGKWLDSTVYDKQISWICEFLGI